MKIRTLWEEGYTRASMPWLVASCDEYTEEEHGGIPELYQEELDKRTTHRRELIIEIPDSAVQKLFEAPVIQGKVLP